MPRSSSSPARRSTPSAARPVALAAGLLLTLAVLLGLASPASAAVGSATDCDVPVGADRGVLSGDTDALEAQVEETAAATGAAVYVRAFDEVPGGDLDAYAEDLIADCRAWSGTAGRDPQLLLVAVSVEDRLSGVYYGDALAPRLDDAWLDVQAEEMNPRFADGDIAGGLEAGVEALGETVTAEEVSGGAVAGFFAVVLALLLLVAGGIWFVVRRKRAARRDAARAEAAAARQAADEAFLGLQEQVTWARVSTDAALADLDPESSDGRELRTQSERALADAEAALAGYAQLQGDLRELGTLDTAAARAQAEQVRVGTAPLAEARRAVDALATRLTEVEALVAGLPAALDAADASLGEARERLSALSEDGWKLERHRAELDGAEDRLAEARELAAARRGISAETTRVDALATVTATLSAAEALPGRREAVLTRQAQGGVEAARLDGLVADAEAALTRMLATYAHPDVDSVDEAPAQARDQVAVARAAFATVGDRAGMDVQDLDAAEEAAADAERALATAQTLAETVLAAEAHLGGLVTALPARVAEMRSRAAALGAFLSRYDDDVDDAVNAVPALTADVADEVDRQLAQDRPLLRAADARLREAETRLAEADGQAKHEREAAEQLRRSATAALRAAEDAVGRTGAYLAGHRGDVGGDSRRQFAAAEAVLAQARAAAREITPTGGHDPAHTCLQLAKQAQGEAESVLQRARRDVDAARRRREEERRRRAAAVSSNRSSGGGSRSSGGRGGGGSRSFGGGGGGSRSFGGGGGGSSRW